jgi:DNA helicase-2/ATP-dependent DNA helicase PcrA
MQELLRDFHVENVIKLEQNYRSHGNILDAANALISNNRNRLGKNLWTAEKGGEQLRVYEAATDVDEARFIVDEIQQLNREGVKLTEMALLYRSNAQSRVLEHALVSAGLSYRVYGGLRFFERQEIKHALAYLRLMENTDDDNALLRIINFPTRGIGARSIEQLQESAKINNTTLWDAAARAGGKVSAFVGLVESLRSATKDLPIPEVMEHVLQHSGLVDHYKNETGAKKREAEERLENLNELINAATLFVHENEDDSLTAFLTHASLESGEHQAGDSEDALHLMTVHAAKGLEFHTVFITGLEEGLFPHQNSQNVEGGMDEERRLMYVAITRARRRLYLTIAQSRMLHGQTSYSMASSFLRELPEALLHWLTPRFSARKTFDTSSLETNSYVKAFAASPITKPQPAPDAMWRIGQHVFHQKFGEGVVTDSEGGGSEGRVQVNFKRAGSKWLALEYAKLTAV